MTKVKEVKLVFSDLSKNSYKQWTGQLFDDGRVVSYWSAVGSTEQTKDYGCKGEYFFNKKIAEKIKKGYEHAKVVLDIGPQQTFVKDKSLVDIALNQIEHSSDSIKSLIVRLVNSNIHKITASTSISYNSSTGLFQTPLGILTLDAIAEARAQLSFFLNNFNIDSNYKRKIDSYLKLVPRQKGNKLNYSDIFPTKESIQKESDLLDALENSLSLLSTQKPNQVKTETKEKVFHTKLEILNNKTERDRIISKYYNTRKNSHVCSHLKIKEIYKVEIQLTKENFDNNSKKIGNIQELWHGTSVSNLLNILRSGLKIQPPSTAKISGALFSSGLYFASASTKSLNYSYGYWSGKRESSVFLFLADVAIGRYFVPSGKMNNPPPSGYDSYWAKPGKSGIINDEYIVPKEYQHNLTYLLEFQE